MELIRYIKEWCGECYYEDKDGIRRRCFFKSMVDRDFHPVRLTYEKVKDEMELIQSCKVPYVPEYYEIIKMTDDEFAVLTQWIEGEELTGYVMTNGDIDGDKMKKQKKVLYNIGERLRKIHESGIVHGDLNLSNILVQEDDTIIFVDLELCEELTKEGMEFDWYYISHVLDLGRDINTYEMYMKKIDEL